MTKYTVSLWPGTGYTVEQTTVEASCTEEALIKATLAGIGYCVAANKVENPDEYPDDLWLYLDRSEYDAENVYLLVENGGIREA